ncbi:hypothetical protein SAMN05192557_0734 [Aliicoccus persicus]|uniref:Uncharacterized protein n=1 Tax=Aliicoccus persicus TaxID=930138 RepID=A0A662Z3B0_9STAP|nr:hypothetical protein SAMN05192557_0734 [Aliicoccus persicus]
MKNKQKFIGKLLFIVGVIITFFTFLRPNKNIVR